MLTTERIEAVDGKPATLLIVDDTPENLAVLGELLASTYRILVANSGARALSLAEAEPRPDLILLDVMMPEMNGYEVFNRLQALPETRDIPVIFVTAQAEPDEEEHGLDVGAVDYIIKPIRPAVVLARVRAQLQVKQARDFLRDQNLFLEKEIARRMADYVLAQDISIQALARLAEIRDPETGNHLIRTREYVKEKKKKIRRKPRGRE